MTETPKPADLAHEQGWPERGTPTVQHSANEIKSLRAISSETVGIGSAGEVEPLNTSPVTRSISAEKLTDARESVLANVRAEIRDEVAYALDLACSA